MALRDLKIGIKQGVGFGLILVVMAGGSIFAIVQMAALRQEIKNFNQFWLERAVVSARLNINTSALRAVQVQHALATTTRQRQVYADSINTLIDQIYTGGDAYDELMEETAQSALFSEEEEQLTADLEGLWDEYLLQTTTVVDLRGQEALDFLNGEMREVFAEFSAKINRLVEINEKSADEAAREADETFTRARNHIVALLVGTILLSIIIAMRLVGSITAPVRSLVTAARKVADGNFAVYLESESKDEIGTLTQSFNWMTRSLKTQQEDLRAANTELQDQKDEIEQKNEDLEETLRRLKETQAQLVLKEKMASLGQLTAGIAHEIKNPLNFVNNFARLSIELTDELNEELDAHQDTPIRDVLGEIEELLSDLRFNAEKIYEHGQRADRIVHGMLEHSRGKSGERRSVAVNDFVEEYVNLAYHGVRARQPGFQVVIDRDYDSAAGTVSLVPQDMGRVLLNLLNNAFYAVHEKKETQADGDEPRVYIRTRAHARQVEIRIEDNGPGIPPPIRARIFEPFFTTKPTGEGNTGLGLSLSYEIVTQGHGGTLAVEHTDEGGAVFIITLPVG